MAKKKYRKTGSGIPCPRCRFISEAREHIAVREKQLNQPFYYKKWYYCYNKACQTTLFMAEEDKVWNHNEKARKMKASKEHQDEIEEQDNFLRLLSKE